MEPISLIIGVSFFTVSYLLGKELKESYFQKDLKISDFNFSRIGIIRQVYALFFPWAYFEPWKVREAYPVLFLKIISFLIGLYFLYLGVAGFQTA